MSRSSLFSFGVLAIAACCYGAQKDMPAWVTQISSRSVSPADGKAPAAVLLSDEHVIVDPSGVMTVTTRKAIRILSREGQRDAIAEEYYFAGGRKVKELQAWLVTPSGFAKTYDKNSVVDLGAFDGMELYNDIRVRRIAAQNPEIGAVFAYESTVEERSPFAEDEYYFQHDLPTAESRYELTLPQGWTARSAVLNHEPLNPTVEASTYVWTLKDLPYREHEEQGPSAEGLAPRLEVLFESSGGASSGTKCFRSWTDVAQWHSELSAGQDRLTPEMIAKARDLTANATTEYQKIQSLGHYVQSIRYVAIEMDEAHGGGYKPHTAESVFHKQYGDCKDKANLLKAMLKAVGIESDLVAIFSGDRTLVREEWPSPTQFNHMILAIRVGDSTVAPAVLARDDGKRLLIFDPTSETTPVGDLPWYEQGSFALLCSPQKGSLLKMPVSKGEVNGVEVAVTATLDPTGKLNASLSSSLHGQAADAMRAAKLYETPEQFREGVQRRLLRAKGLTLTKLETQDSFNANVLRETLDFESQNYGQAMRRNMLVFSISVVEPSIYFFPRVSRRTEPIVLRAQSYRKEVRLKIPGGFQVDEMPLPVSSQEDFGSFKIDFKQEGNTLVLTETLQVEPLTVPADRYESVKRFFDQFNGGEQQQAVLVKN